LPTLDHISIRAKRENGMKISVLQALPLYP
jgi:hypothetical protein